MTRGVCLRVLAVAGPAVVVDLGRYGHRAWGVAPSGALDRAAAAAANRLAGNPDGAAVLELVGAAAFEAEAGGWLATAGAPWDVRVDGVGQPPWTSFPVRRGQRLELRPRGPGWRCYLAAAGGWDVPVVLGSRTTDLAAGLGGHAGRPLRPGDRLCALRAADPGARTVPPHARPTWPAEGEVPLRVVLGPQADRFPPESLSRFLEHPFRVGPRSDRAACRLEGPPVPPADAESFVSEPVPTGAVQVPPDGRPVLLLSGGPTVGGYPKIAVVIDSDLDRAGQLRPGQPVRFHAVGLEEAHRALYEYRSRLARLPVEPLRRRVAVSVDGVAYRVEIQEHGGGGWGRP